jgi:hypothetical protein
MKSKLRMLVGVSALVASLSVSAFAAKSSAKHTAVGTISSISGDQVVVNEKVNGKEQPMTFKMDSATLKSGNLKAGSLVTVKYHSDKNQNVANAVRERSANATAKKSAKKAKKS